MKHGRKKTDVVVAAIAVAIVFLIVFGTPRFRLWQAKQQAWRELAGIPAEQKAAMNCVLAPQVKAIPPEPADGDAVVLSKAGYEFALPAAEYRHAEDANDSIESDLLRLRLLSVAPRVPEFADQLAPTSPAVRDWLARADPYDILVETYNATVGGIREQTTRAGLQKHLYLLLLKSILQPTGSDKRFLRFEAGGRKGILSGDTSVELVVVLLYLPETKAFAEIVIAPRDKGEAEMASVYRCLGQLRVRRP